MHDPIKKMVTHRIEATMLKRYIGTGILLGGIFAAGCTWCEGNGILRKSSSRNPDKAFSTVPGTGEVIVQEGAPIIEEGPTVTISQDASQITPGISTQTSPPPTIPQNSLPLTPTPNPTTPAPKLVPQAQPAPANPTSAGKV